MYDTLSVPVYLRPLLALFESHGQRAYPVGGCVRDTLMGIPPHDWDMAVTTAPEDTVEICRAAGYRTIPTGLRHGTVSVLVPHSGVPADRVGAYDLVECTTCRTEGGYSDGRHPDAVSFTGRIEDDLARRDFTVNAMALTKEGEGLAVLDLFGGREDLQNRVIRAVGDPDTRFTEDALRLLRAIRFAVKLDFSIEATTYAAAVRQGSGLSRISRERISEEFQRILISAAPQRGITLLTNMGFMPYVLPAGISSVGVEGVALLPREFRLRMACLQWGMEEAQVEQNLAGLRLPNVVRRDVLAILRSAADDVTPTPANARRWRSVLGDLAIPALEVRRAADAHSRESAEALAALVSASAARGDPVRISDLAINGNDLLALGFEKGRILQDVLYRLLTLVWEFPEKNTREELISLINRDRRGEN